MRFLFASSMEVSAPLLRELAVAHTLVGFVTLASVLRRRRSALLSAAAEGGVHTGVHTGDFCAFDWGDSVADVAIVYGYGRILRAEELAAFRYGCLNLHPSALPRWRGAAPIERSVLAGDSTTAISVLEMTKELDAGAIWAQEFVALQPGLGAAHLYDLTNSLGASLLGGVLARLAAYPDIAAARRAEPPTAQAAVGVSYAAKLTPAEERIDWRLPARAIVAQISAMDAGAGCWSTYADTRVRFFSATLMSGASGGVVSSVGAGGVAAIAGGIAIEAGDGQWVWVHELQRAGKRRMAAKDFLNGFPLAVGEAFA